MNCLNSKSPRKKKNIPFGAAHTYMAYLREYNPTPHPPGWETEGHPANRAVLSLGRFERTRERLCISAWID